MRQRRSAVYVAAMVDDPQRQLPGSAMPRTAMPPATRDLVVRYLQGLPGRGDTPSPPPPASTNAEADGATLYARWCASCHGAHGRGDGPNATHLPVKPSVHADGEAMRQRSDDALHDTIASGGLLMNRSARMPAFGETLTTREIRELVAHIRRLCRCQGPAWSRP
ncbi:MAG: c-type cytochrome [Gemmatimonadaceae bacterium]